MGLQSVSTNIRLNCTLGKDSRSHVMGGDTYLKLNNSYIRSFVLSSMRPLVLRKAHMTYTIDKNSRFNLVGNIGNVVLLSFHGGWYYMDAMKL